MLNGLDPLIVIVIGVGFPIELLDPPVPGVGADISPSIPLVGIPIPIYLAENPLKALGSFAPGGAAGRAISQSGIYVESETRSIDLTTKVEATSGIDPLTQDIKRPSVTQQVYDTQVTVNLIAQRDSVIVTAMIAMMEFIMNRLITRGYAIHYINKSTVIFGGLLHRFSTSINPNEDKIHIEMTLSTAAKTLPVGKAPIEEIKNTATSTLSVHP